MLFWFFYWFYKSQKHFKLFIIDNQLRFEDQVKFICKKVNSITGILCKSSYLFTDKIKPSIFKLFIMNRFKYCGAAILHLLDKKCMNRLKKCFSNSISRFLRVKINSFQDIDSFCFKKKFNIFPWNIGFFFIFVHFYLIFVNQTIFFTKIILLKIREIPEQYSWKISLKLILANSRSQQ